MAVLEVSRRRLRDVNMLGGWDRKPVQGPPRLSSERLPWPGLEPGFLMPALRGPAYITGLSHDQERQ